MGRAFVIVAFSAVVCAVGAPHAFARTAACDPKHPPERVVVSVSSCWPQDRHAGFNLGGDTVAAPSESEADGDDDSSSPSRKRIFYVRQPETACEDVFGMDVKAMARYGSCCKQGRKVPCLEDIEILQRTPHKGFGQHVFLLGPTYRSHYTWGLEGTYVGGHAVLTRVAELLLWRVSVGALRHISGERPRSGYADAGLCYGFFLHACVVGGTRYDGAAARGEAALEVGLGFVLGLDVRHLAGAEKPEYGATLRFPVN